MRDSKFNLLRILNIPKRSLLGLIIIVMIVQSLTVAPSTALGAASDFAGGDGTKENPYLIATAEQLDKIRNELDKHYRLIADIDLSGYSNWLPIPVFAGSLDGDGHTISNLTINRNETDDVGLISIARMDNAEGDYISNLKMNNVKIIGQAGVGSLIGRINSGTVSNVQVDQVEIQGKGEAVGGLVGRIDSNTTITDSSATNVTVIGAKSHVGGLTGRNAAAAGTSATVSNSFASGSVKGTGNHVGGLMGSLNNGTVTDSYSTVQVEGNNNNTGGLIGIIDAGKVLNSNAMGNVKGGAFTGGLVGTLVNGAIINSYSTGTTEGTEHTTGGLVGQMTHANSLIEHSRAEGDVLGNHSHVGGLVGALYLGNIKNGIAEGNVSNIGTGENTGGLIGWMEGGTTVSHSTASGNVTKTGSQGGSIGGLIGRQDNGTIKSSSASGQVTNNITVKGTWNTGGLIGRLKNGTVEDSSTSGEVVGNLGENTGGLIGSVESGLVLSSSSAGNVSSTFSNTGGLIGIIETGQVRNSSATGDVSNGDSNVGGLIGWVEKQAIVSDSFARGNVSTFGFVDVDSSNVGGLIGGVGHNVASGDLIDDLQLIRVHAYGNVNAKQGNAGGLVGFLHGNVNTLIEDSSASGSVTAEGTRSDEKAGGLVGELLGGNIQSSRASGDIQGVMAGGLIGRLNPQYPIHINDVYYSGSVQGRESAGGIIGVLESFSGEVTLSRAFASGQVTMGKRIGGIIGNIETMQDVLIQDVYALQSKIGDQATPTDTIHRVIGDIAHWSVSGKKAILKNLRADPAMDIDEKRKSGLDSWAGQDVDVEVEDARGSRNTEKIRVAYNVVLPIPIEEPIRQALLDRLADFPFFEVKMPNVTTEPLLIGNQLVLPIQYRTVGSLNGNLSVTIGSQNIMLPITDPLPDTAGEWQDFVVEWDNTISPLADGSYSSINIKFNTTGRSWSYPWNQAIIKDTAPPHITLAAKKADATEYVAGTVANQSVTVSSSVSDELTEVVSHQYQLNGEAWKDYIGPILLDSDGDHIIVFKARDKAGNEQLSSELMINIKLNSAEFPVITIHPSDITVNVGSNVTLSVSASVSDGGELTYQWYSNTSNSTSRGTAISGATTTTYEVPTFIDGTTYYYVEVTNTNTDVTGSHTATTTSQVAEVTVNKLTNAEAPTLVIRYPLNITVNVGDYRELSVYAGVSDGGTLSYQWYSNTVKSTSGGTAISGEISETYVVPTTTVGTTYYYLVVTNTNTKVTGKQTESTNTVVAMVTVNELINAEHATITTDPSDITVNAGEAGTLSVVASVDDGGTLSYQWYNNTSNSNIGGTAISDATSATYEVPTNKAGTTYYYVEVTNTNTEATGSQTAATTSQVAVVTVHELTNADKPTIATHPTNQTVQVGTEATLNVVATVNDSGTLSYQWYSNTSNTTSDGTAISGATSATYEVPTSEAGTTYYYVEVTNTNTEVTGSQTATTTSQVAVVTVKELTEPTNADQPIVATHPSNLTVSVGSKATLNVVATVNDGGTLSYQWYSSTSNSTSDGIAISGATSATYEVPTNKAGTTYYYVEVTNTNTEVTGSQTATTTSQVAMVTVKKLTEPTNAVTPVITLHPSPITVSVGSEAPLNVVATVNDGGTLSYQWYSNTSNTTSGGTAISGATSESYEVSTNEAGITYYYVEVTNTNVDATGSQTATTTSQVVVVTVRELTEPTNAVTPAITQHPSPITVSVGSEATLNIVATVNDGGTLSYQWYSNTSNSTSDGIPISGATSATYEVPTNEAGTSYYYVEVTNTNTEATGSQTATTTSQVAVVTVNELANVSQPIASPRGATISSGTKVELSTTTIDATIYYTMDGSTPTNNSTQYTRPIEIKEAVTIKAIAVKDGMNDSNVMTEHYTIAAAVPAPKNLTANAGNRSIALKWDAVTETDTVSYAVYQYEGKAAPLNPNEWVLVRADIVESEYSVTDLKNGKNYTFSVKAFVEGSSSDFSNVATASPKASGSNGGGGGTWVITEPENVTSDNGIITMPVGSAGEVSLDREIIIKIPKDAVDQELRITIDKLLDADSLLSEKEMLVSSAFEVTKNVSDNFKKPVSISIKFNPAKVSNNQKVSIFYYDEDKKIWTEVGGVIEGEWITTEVDHFTKFAVLAVNMKKEDGEDSTKQPTPSFTDIAGHWGERSIIRAAEHRLVGGYPDGTFKPDQRVTRAEFTVMLAKVLQLDGTVAELNFKDQDKIGAWAKHEVSLAVQRGIVNGYEDGSFRPDAPITRAEMAVMIARSMELNLNAYRATGFADDESVPQWAKGSVEAIRILNIISGRSDNKFVPNDMTTRTEAIVVLLRLLEVKASQ